mmetsp:Transcript_52066/g.112832  ORF Transcript_52066/g.112832 Transcript_52066/m.112832 type:complete len:261 (-) Transcript_52066:546-1328(-)
MVGRTKTAVPSFRISMMDWAVASVSRMDLGQSRTSQAIWDMATASTIHRVHKRTVCCSIVILRDCIVQAQTAPTVRRVHPWGRYAQRSISRGRERSSCPRRRQNLEPFGKRLLELAALRQRKLPLQARLPVKLRPLLNWLREWLQGLGRWAQVPLRARKTRARPQLSPRTQVFFPRLHAGLRSKLPDPLTPTSCSCAMASSTSQMTGTLWQECGVQVLHPAARILGSPMSSSSTLMDLKRGPASLAVLLRSCSTQKMRAL